MTSPITNILGQLTEAAAGRTTVARLVLCAALAGGHVVLDDLPGTGKTTLAKALGQVLGLSFRRLQGTSDLLPSDIVGVNIFHRDEEKFVFHKGPIFAHVLLCDELNRCPPRTQSALLEGMAEQQVTMDGETFALPQPFLVIATQNPVDGQSTLALPDAQWDRFMFHLTMGRLAPESEKRLLQNPRWVHIPMTAQNVEGDAGRKNTFQAWASASQTPVLSEAITDYLFALLEASRHAFPDRGGLSTRAGQSIARAARAWAWMEGRDYVVPEDIQAVFVPASLHRLIASDQLTVASEHARVEALLTQVAVPL